MSLAKKVSLVLKQVRPQIQAHGGDLKLIKAQEGKVVIKILGACLGCALVEETFGSGVEKLLKKELPEVKKIQFIT